MGKVLGWIGSILAVALVAGGTVLYIKDRASQAKDFKADLAAVGFANTNPKWEDEDDGSELEANVAVAGCKVIEFERKSGEKTAGGTVAGRKIERYDVDGVVHNGREIPTDDFVGTMATPTDIKTYLIKHGKNRFPCLNPAA